MEVLAVVKEREEKASKIDWQFSIESARNKLKRQDQQVKLAMSAIKELGFQSAPSPHKRQNHFHILISISECELEQRVTICS
jgi:hypothetical protein